LDLCVAAFSFLLRATIHLPLQLTMRRVLATLAVVVALLFSAGLACADFYDGLAAYNRGDYATALQEWRPFAEQGDADAQYNLGCPSSYNLE